jgi:CBS domain-containing protein
MSTLQKTNEKRIEFIRAHAPFNCLGDAELKRVEQTLETLRFAPGAHILVQDGPPSHYLYLIRKGSIRVVHDGQVIQVMEEGDVFGYPSMLNKKACTFDVVAEEDTVIYGIKEEIFYELVDNLVFAEFFLKSLSERLHRSFRGKTPPLTGDLHTLVGDLIVRPPVMVTPDNTVAEAAEVMRKAWVDAALVADEPVGIITDRDFLVRVLAQELGPQTLVRTVMSRPVKTISVDTPVYIALIFMLEQDVHHLALTRKGKIEGVISADALLRHQAKNPLYFLRQLEHSEDSDKILTRYALNVGGTVETLHKGGLDVAQIGRIVASLNGALIRRLLKSAEKELGPPPTPYAWIVFGSEGRMEQMLLTDQDNAMIYKEETAGARNYFKAMAERVVNGLIKAGIPPCPGGYMATNWCRSLDEWLRLFKSWVNTPEPEALLKACVFFDFRSVYGELSLEPLERVLFETGEQSIFLAHMSQTALEFRPPLSLFRRIRDEAGQVDLKKGGVAPIVHMARFYALGAGIRTRSTFERLEAAAQAGTLSRDGADALAETYRFLLQLRLQEQLAEIKAGDVPDNKIHLRSLSARENRRLKEAFMVIRGMQESISQHY